ncbi:gliding motility lipoprotein GldD [Solitalea lacus]|uniref:gliding motility lipoprotein GldD n=1 Tax=Solitalea lacus TaxID=2911172 RepID=UPI001EDB4D3B|nr:gliding motility lipoprotein GldD [Solitalea lacus]UKJ08147.1 gliding motility lipoprotein GldD [Solitalea lacus]
MIVLNKSNLLKLASRLTVLGILGIFLFLNACQQSASTPKPRGYHRIDFPKKAYVHYDGGCSYSFDIPVYANVTPDVSAEARPCWININYPQFNGKLHITYHDFDNDQKRFNQLTEYSRELVFKHTIKATSIDESIIKDNKRRVYGTYYTIGGNTASSLQLYLTDSTKHFLRAALYFRSEPKLDSIQPVLDFIKKDIDVMLKTFKWKN